MSFKKIIILAAAGLISFSITFFVTWFLSPTEFSSPNAATDTATATGDQQLSELPSLSSIAEKNSTDKISKSLTEKKLENLIYEVRAKIQEYKDKLKAVELQEERMQIAEQTLRNNIDKLNEMRSELSMIVANIRNERDKLEKSKVEIANAESSNLQAIANTYNRMDPTSASDILTNMSKMQTVNGQTGLDDVVKILHYMEDRTKANLLAELSNKEPKLAAVLCQKLKKIVEVK